MEADSRYASRSPTSRSRTATNRATLATGTSTATAIDGGAAIRPPEATTGANPPATVTAAPSTLARRVSAYALSASATGRHSQNASPPPASVTTPAVARAAAALAIAYARRGRFEAAAPGLKRWRPSGISARSVARRSDGARAPGR